MNTRIFLIHGWGGKPTNDWLPWAKTIFSKKGYEVIAPSMSDSDHPRITPWVEKLKRLVGNPRKTDIFIGHSIGCQTILRYLETLSPDQQIAKAILIAPWLELSNLETEEGWKIADPWLKGSINFPIVKTMSKSFITIFSDNDPWVPMDKNVSLFKEKLSPKIVVLKNRGHFTEDEGIKEIAELLDLV